MGGGGEGAHGVSPFLGSLVARAPKKPHTEHLRPTTQSKGGILSKACDYVRELRQSNQRLQETFKEAERLQMDNDLLRQQVPGPAPSS